MSEEEMSLKEFLKELYKKHGVTKVNVSYSGSNDEGWVDEADFFNAKKQQMSLDDKTVQQMNEFAYGLLEDLWPGWETNEGSNGVITFETKTGQYKFERTEYVERTRKGAGKLT